MMDDNKPHSDIADMIESDDDFARANFFSAPNAPHPAQREVPQNFGGDEDGDSDLSAMPVDADRLSIDIIAANALEPQNDTGNGRRLLRWFGDDVLHVRDVGWLAWTGTYWLRKRGEEMLVQRCQQTAERIALEAAFIAATPSERAAIEAGEQAAADLAALEKLAKLSDAQKKQKARLQYTVEAGSAFPRTLLSSGLSFLLPLQMRTNDHLRFDNIFARS